MTPIALKGLPDNVRKFLMLITHTEGTDRDGKPYNVMFGYHYFTDLSTHPDKVIADSKFPSSAAGRYQFLKKTYDGLKMTDFHPETQDKGAIQLIKMRKAYDDVVAGHWESAIKKCNTIWASLPGSPYGQPTHKIEDALAFLKTA